ncbi:UNVERIFIED_CONTAM: PE-PPE domain-containing protein [Williamsia faeni]
MGTTVITARGTGAHRWDPNSLLTGVVHLLGDLVEWVDLDYDASIAVFNPFGRVDGVSEEVSRQHGVANLARAIRETPHRVVLAGYSLGALVVSDFLAAQARGEFADCEVSAVVLIANPARVPGVSYGLPSFGYGLDGTHPRWPAVPTYEIANPVDMITSAPANSPWRQFADQIRAFSLGDVPSWMHHMLDQLDGAERRQALDQWWEPTFWQSYAEAPVWLRGYLSDGQHTVAYSQPHWCDDSGRKVTGIELAASAISHHL